MATLYKVVTQFTGVAGSPYFNTLMFAGSGGSAQQAATAVRTFWNALQGNLADTLRGQVDLEVTSIESSTGDPNGVTAVTSSQIVYTASNTMLPRSSQGLVKLRTGAFLNKREIRGRIFIPCLTEVANDIGVPSTTIISTVNTAAAALIADGTSDLIIYSNTHHSFASVVSATMWTEWAQLRTRRD